MRISILANTNLKTVIYFHFFIIQKLDHDKNYNIRQKPKFLKNDAEVERDNSMNSWGDKKKNNEAKPKLKNFEEYLESKMEEIYKNKENQNFKYKNHENEEIKNEDPQPVLFKSDIEKSMPEMVTYKFEWYYFMNFKTIEKINK